MDIINVLSDKATKPLEKRAKMVEALDTCLMTITEIQALKNVLDDKKLTLVLEAMEDVTNKNPAVANTKWLLLAQDCVLSNSNNL